MSNIFEGAFILKNVFSDQQCNVIDASDSMCDPSHPRINNILEQLLDTPSYFPTHRQRVTLPSNVETRAWRLGQPYENTSKRSNDPTLEFDHTYLKGVEVHIPQGDLTVNNGGYMYVPHSHLAFQYPCNARLAHGSFVEKENPMSVHPCKKKTLTCSKGDVLIFPSTLWFTYGKNITSTDTIIDTFTFGPM
jgi:hypothetical protein